MKQNLPLLWWLVSSIAIALVFGASGYAPDQAVLQNYRSCDKSGAPPAKRPLV